MIVTTTENIPGYEIKKYVGVVWSSSARAKHLGHDIAAMAKAALVGGELSSYRKMMNEARNDVLQGIIKNAEKIGANAIIGVRLGSTQIMPATVDIFAYGTAVIIEEEKKKK
ncbi:YbjQ family protein [Candidatus Micrarchaeota archaeon]|nr:YbjQ family protein [Candidatus Micrarchaeota archaeon]